MPSRFLIIPALLSTLVNNPDPPLLRAYQHTQVHMGMPVRVVLYAVDEDAARQAALAAFGRIAALDRMMSDYRPDSELKGLEHRAGEWVAVSAELFTIIERAVGMARATDGAFDPTIGPLVALWREARKSGRLPERAALDASRARVGWRQIDLDPGLRAIRLANSGMRLDLGGIAKGYILQEALHTLGAHGVTRALLEAGGDIVVGDAPPGKDGWHIEARAVAPPLFELRRAGQAFSDRARRLTNAALATSGATAQFIERDGARYSHVIDPRTGLGLTNQCIARVIAEDASTADALATALSVVGPQRAPELTARFPGVMVSIEREPQPPNR